MRREQWLVGLLLGAMLILLLGVCDSAGHHRLTSTTSAAESVLPAAPGTGLADQPRATDPVDGDCHGGSRSVEEHTANKPDGGGDRVADTEVGSKSSPGGEARLRAPQAVADVLTRANPRGLSCVDRR
ncbi:hypothetical protein ACIA8F_34980 [Streptomyces sp. NPDC051563]|uniref:hypothetical protein n=1 Tax=Streptomyces sp. NPDC051563 TaxID=3365659 RepID=UPI00379A8C62